METPSQETKTSLHEAEQASHGLQNTEVPNNETRSAGVSGQKVTWRALLAVFALSLGFGTNYGVAANMPPSVLLDISADFGPHGQALQNWIAIVWLLTWGLTFALCGRLSDIFGRRYIILVGNCFTVISFIICATTHRFDTLVGGLAFAGIAGGMVSTAVAGVSEMLPFKYRPYGLAFLELSIAPLGYLGGNYFAHLITQNLGWRWIFWVGTIISGFATILVGLTYWPPTEGSATEGTHTSKLTSAAKLDWIGMLIFAGSLASFLLGITWAAGLYSSKDVHVVAPITCGLVGLILFGLYEVYVAKDNGIIPTRVFRGKARSMGGVLVVKFVAASIFFTQITLWPQQAGILYATSYLDNGVLGLPFGSGIVLGGVILSAFIHKLGPTQWQLRAGIIWQVALTAAMASLHPTSRGLACALQFLSGIPFLYVVNLAYLTSQLLNEEADIGIASGLTGTIRAVGGAVGVAVYTTVFANEVRDTVPSRIAAAAASAGLPTASIEAFVGALMTQNSEALGSIEGVTPTIIGASVEALKSGYSSCFRVVYLATLGFGGVGIIASFLVTDVSHSLKSDVIAVQMPPREKPKESEDRNVV